MLTLLPVLVLNNKKEDQPLTTRDYIGWGLWGLGFVFEVLADHQKSVFKANPDNAVSTLATKLHTCIMLCATPSLTESYISNSYYVLASMCITTIDTHII